MLTQKMLFDTIKDLVIHAPEVKRNVRLNCFGVVDRKDDLSGAALGLQVDDFYEGYFWARDWVNRGASAAEGLEKSYPLLAVEHKIVRPYDIASNTAQLEVWFNLLDTKDCGGRLHEARTRETVYWDNIGMLRALFVELFSVQGYTYKKAGQSDYEKWASPGLTASLLAAGEIDSANPTGEDFGAVSSRKGVEIFKNPRLNNDGAIAVTAKLEVEVCLEAPPEYSYSTTTPDPVPITASKQQ